MALQGRTAQEILAHYYPGTTLRRHPAPPAVRVGLATGLERVAVTGSFIMKDEDNRILRKHALGTWSFEWDGSGATSVEPPVGLGLPLTVAIVDAPARVTPSTTARIVVALSRPAKVSVSPSGAGEGAPAVLNGGRRTIRWKSPSSPGAYEVVIEAIQGGHRVLDRVAVDVVRPAPEGPPPSGIPAPAALLAVAFVALGVAVLAGTIRR